MKNYDDMKFIFNFKLFNITLKNFENKLFFQFF